MSSDKPMQVPIAILLKGDYFFDELVLQKITETKTSSLPVVLVEDDELSLEL